MFEQSLLIDHSGGRKTATFAVSLTAQIFIAGVLLVAPLFYREVLPALRMPEMVPVLERWRPPEAPVIEPRRDARTRGLASSGVFHPPAVHHTDYPQAGMVIVDFDTPALPAKSLLTISIRKILLTN